jgi:hypothetical protein
MAASATDSGQECARALKDFQKPSLSKDRFQIRSLADVVACHVQTVTGKEYARAAIYKLHPFFFEGAKPLALHSAFADKAAALQKQLQICNHMRAKQQHIP